MPSTLAYFFHTPELAADIEERIRTRVIDPAAIELVQGAYERSDAIGTSGCNQARYPMADLTPCSVCGNIHHRNGIDGSTIFPNGRNFCSTDCAFEGGVVSVCGQTIDLQDCRHQLLSYSASPERIDSTTSRDPYLFGVEVEKEDYEHKERALREALEREWIAVSDGSLGCDGFELVSPAYNLTASRDEWLSCFRQWDILNCNCSTSCGGHITVSKRGVSGPQLTRRFGDTIPLLFAMFPYRLRSQWSTPRNSSQMSDSGDKYRAVNVKRSTVELRIFSRVQSGSQLEARVNLLSDCIQRDECTGFEDELADRDSSLWQAVDLCYSGFESEAERDSKRDTAIERFGMFKQWYYGRYASTDLNDENGPLYPIRKFIRRAY